MIFRLIGLSALVRFKCTQSWWEFHSPNYFSWTAYLNFCLLIGIYHLIIIQLKWTINGIKPYGKDNLTNEQDDGSSAHEEVSLYIKFLN